MSELERIYESATGEKALYRKGSSDYHTLRYVRWLEEMCRPPAIDRDTITRIADEIADKGVCVARFGTMICFPWFVETAQALRAALSDSPAECTGCRYEKSLCISDACATCTRFDVERTDRFTPIDKEVTFPEVLRDINNIITKKDD